VRRSYEGSDSCPRSPPPTGIPAYCATPSDHSVPKHVVSHDHRLFSPARRGHRFSGFALNPQARRNTPPNRVRTLRTDRSPPVAPHLASRRRSYLRLPSFGILGHGLSPCRLSAITGAHRGRGGSRLPSLRTVRAVLPHTALQSDVSTSGRADAANAPKVIASALPTRSPVTRAARRPSPLTDTVRRH